MAAPARKWGSVGIHGWPRPEDTKELSLSDGLLFQQRLGEGVKSSARRFQEFAHSSLTLHEQMLDLLIDP